MFLLVMSLLGSNALSASGEFCMDVISRNKNAGDQTSKSSFFFSEFTYARFVQNSKTFPYRLLFSCFHSMYFVCVLETATAVQSYGLAAVRGVSDDRALAAQRAAESCLQSSLRSWLHQSWLLTFLPWSFCFDVFVFRCNAFFKSTSILFLRIVRGKLLWKMNQGKNQIRSEC